MTFRQKPIAPLHDWITPPHVDILSVVAPAERLKRFEQLGDELKEKMGSGYKVRRPHGRSYRVHESDGASNVMSIQRAG